MSINVCDTSIENPRIMEGPTLSKIVDEIEKGNYACYVYLESGRNRPDLLFLNRTNVETISETVKDIVERGDGFIVIFEKMDFAIDEGDGFAEEDE